MTRTLPTVEQLTQYVASSHWGQTCLNMFAHLAVSDPQKLLDFIEVYPWDCNLDLAYAALACGLIEQRDGVSKILVPLLKHAHGYVREGTARGICQDNTQPEVRAALVAALEVEPFESVAEGIQEALEWKKGDRI